MLMVTTLLQLPIFRASNYTVEYLKLTFYMNNINEISSFYFILLLYRLEGLVIK